MLSVMLSGRELFWERRVDYVLSPCKDGRVHGATDRIVELMRHQAPKRQTLTHTTGPAEPF